MHICWYILNANNNAIMVCPRDQLQSKFSALYCFQYMLRKGTPRITFFTSTVFFKRFCAVLISILPPIGSNNNLTTLPTAFDFHYHYMCDRKNNNWFLIQSDLTKRNSGASNAFLPWPEVAWAIPYVIFCVVLHHKKKKWPPWIQLGHSWYVPEALFLTMIADTLIMMVGTVRCQINTNSSSTTMIAKLWLWLNAKQSSQWTSHKGLKNIMFKWDNGRAATRRVSYLGFGFLREITIRKCLRTARLFTFGF